MKKSIYPDPFELAKRLIMAYPADEPWETSKSASAQEFIQAVDDFLAGKISEEALLDEKYGYHSGMVQDHGGDDGNIFILRHRPIDREALRAWRESDFGGKDYITASEMMYTSQGLSSVNKKILLPEEIGKQYTDLVSMLAEQAIRRVVPDTRTGSFIDIIPPVSVGIEKDEITYTNFLDTEVPDFRQRALMELQKLRGELAELFEPQKNGFFLLPGDKRMIKFPRLIESLAEYFENTAEPENDRERMRRNMDNKAGGENAAYYIDGKKVEITASDLNRMMLIEIAMDRLARGGDSASKMKSLFGTAEQMLDSYKESFGQEEFERLEGLVKARKEDRLQEYYEINDPAQVAWVKRYIMPDQNQSPLPPNS